jgi:hypothetical protein
MGASVTVVNTFTYSGNAYSYPGGVTATHSAIS